MSKKENKILDPLTIVVMEPSGHTDSKSIVDHSTGSITKSDWEGMIKDTYDYIVRYSSYHKFSFKFTEADFQDCCERLWIAYLDKCHDFKSNSFYDVLKPRTLLVFIPRVSPTLCNDISVEFMCDWRHYEHAKLVSISNYIIKFDFNKPTLIDKDGKLITPIYPYYADSHEER